MTAIHHFISKCRPDPGQKEVATYIRSFLGGSQLSQNMNVKRQGLVEDRYALRTVPRWIGPVLEDFSFAHRQITIELNSSTDNPLIDVDGDCFHHGGNFQAASIISAVKKTKLGLMMLGRLLVSQCQKLINPFLNQGLSPNLCFDGPSLSFNCK
jgi:phenylalanine ammonia-lyase